MTITRVTSSPSSKLVGSMAFLMSYGMVLQVSTDSTRTPNGKDTVRMAPSFSQPGTDPTLCSTRFTSSFISQCY